MTPQRVLLTGASGSLGSHTARALVERGHAVRALVRDRARLARRDARFDAAPPELEIVAGDLRAAIPTQAWQGVDVVVHTAALLTGDDEDIERVNVDGTRRLVQAANDAGVSRFVFASSIAVYRDGPLVDAREDTPRGGGTAYARSKERGEDLVLEACAGGSMTAVVLRLPILVDRREDSFLAQLSDAVRRFAIPTTPDGGALLELLHASDAAQGMAAAATADVDRTVAWNLGGRRLRVAEIVRAAASAMGVEATLFDVDPDVSLGAKPSDWGTRGGVSGRPALPWSLVPAALTDRSLNGSCGVAGLGVSPEIDVLDGLRRSLRVCYD